MHSFHSHSWRHLGLNPSFKKGEGVDMWRQNILLKPTETDLLEEADCTQKLPGSGRAVDSETRGGLRWPSVGGPGPSASARSGRNGASGGGTWSSPRSWSFWFSSKGLHPDKKPMTDYKNKNN